MQYELIVLIGMPGAGKTSVGKCLAALLGIPFIDTDETIEAAVGRSLQCVLNEQGVDALMALEERVLLSMPLPSSGVVATGGSAVYAEHGMSRLKQHGLVVYLEVGLDTVKVRVKNWQERGFVSLPGQNLEDVYYQRIPLYQHFADITVDAEGDNINDIAELVFKAVNQYQFTKKNL
jgi:shikimate kinase